MKKIKGKLAKRSSQLNVDSLNSVDWTKYDDRLLECIEQDDIARLRTTLAKKGVSSVKLGHHGTTALHTACQRGSIECFDVLLEEHPDLSVVDKSGCDILHAAAKAEHTECVQKLLEHNVNVSSQDAQKMTALHHAAAKGHQASAELLVNNNAPLDIVDRDGRTPLLIGIQSGHEEVVKLLLDRGAKVNITDNARKTALMYASLLGLMKSVELLLKRGANSKLEDGNGHTAEDYARIGGNKEIIPMFKNAPTVATWDAGDDTEQEEEQPEIPNGELVSEFNIHDDSEEISIASYQNSVPSSSTRVASSINSEKSSLQESFSSKASTAVSSHRMTLERDLTIDVKELEEENEMLNQELNKLRVQHQKTLERLRFTEVELDVEKKKAPASPVQAHMNGSIEEDLVEEKDRKIEELEQEVTKLKVELKKETIAKREAEEEIETLKIQVDSYQDEEGNSSLMLSDYEEEDVDLPGMEGNHSPRNNKNIKVPSAHVLVSLNGQITTLKLENEALREMMDKLQINGEINHNDLQEKVAIPLPVYQQLKESTEEEVFQLTEQIEELKMANEVLEQEVIDTRKDCEKCRNAKTEKQSLADLSHKTYLESEVCRLKNRIKESDAEYKHKINLYRLHLLGAVQGELNSDVEQAILAILSLRSNEQFC